VRSLTRSLAVTDPATERVRIGLQRKYHDFKGNGRTFAAAWPNPLFSSDTKYDSGRGGGLAELLGAHSEKSIKDGHGRGFS